MNDVLRGTVTATRQLTPHVREIEVAPENLLEYEAGQWLSLRLPVGEKPPLNRAYSLATPPTRKGTLTLCLDRVEDGLGSGYLWDVEIGAEIEFTGPHGNFVLSDEPKPLLFVARYTGVVPFRAMLEALVEMGGRPVHLVYIAPEASEFVYQKEINALSENADWLTVAFAGDGEEFVLLDNWEPHADGFIPYVCGVRGFTKGVREYLMARFGLDRRAVNLEHFS